MLLSNQFKNKATKSASDFLFPTNHLNIAFHANHPYFFDSNSRTIVQIKLTFKR